MTRELLMKTLAILFGGFLVIVLTFTGNSTVVVSYPKMKWTNRNNVQEYVEEMPNYTHLIRNKNETMGLANEQFRSVDFYKRNWKGDCPYPKFFDPNLEKESWFPRFLYHLQRVNMTAVPKKRFKEKCYR